MDGKLMYQLLGGRAGLYVLYLSFAVWIYFIYDKFRRPK